MDEYLGFPGAPRSFAEWLKAHLFDRQPFDEVHLMAVDNKSLASLHA